MYKNFIFLLVVLSLIPACFKKKPALVQPVAVVSDENRIAQEGPASDEDLAPQAFDVDQDQPESGDVDEYVFDQKGDSPFDQDAAENYEELALENADTKASDIENNSKKLGLQTVYYDFNKKSIKADQKAKVASNVKVAKDLVNKGYDLVVEGHACDSAGSPQYNLVLSEDRAKGMMQHLANNGVDKKHMKIVGRGSEMRIVQFGNREQQAPNRRVEIYAYDKSKNQVA